MEYNTTRSKLLMPEYGRNVQKMIEYLVTVDDREKRLKQAEVIIELMGTLNPHLKTIEDYKHKLWDHLYQMTDFNLDVDSPYPCPTRESVYKKPEVLPYPQGTIKHRHLGKNMQELLDKAMVETDEEKRHGLTQAIGYYMKLAYANWHREPVHDDMIKNELAELTEGKLRYETGGYRVHVDTRTFKQRNNNSGNNRNFKGQGGQGGGQRNNSGYGGQGGQSGQGGQGGGGNNFNKNRKFKNNKNK
jgi:CRISPR/Cas system-associated endonuclease Cas1